MACFDTTTEQGRHGKERMLSIPNGLWLGLSQCWEYHPQQVAVTICNPAGSYIATAFVRQCMPAAGGRVKHTIV